MKMETLYKRAKTGKIVSYRIFVEDQLSDNNPHPVIVKETGQLDGKKTYHREPVPVGKQKRTALEQAEAQALSDWKSKKDSGYKSLSDLDIVCREEEIGLALEKALPQFNTGSDGQILPMLAKAVDWNKVTYPCLVQPKLDGVRCLMVSDNDSVTFLSRNGKEYTTLNHIELDVVQYVNSERCLQPRFICDGEIYSDELSFQQIIAAVKKQRDDSLKLRFRAYDIVNDELQKDRWTTTVALVDAISSPLVWPVPAIVAQAKQDVKDWHDRYVQEGYEGVMIRLYDGKYGQGQRSSALLKVKEFQEDEFEFVKFEIGQREEDLIAVCLTGTGTEFRAKMIGTKTEKEVIRDYPNLAGSKLTVKYFGLTDELNVPRFPIGKAFRNYY